ncbi:MAG: hypothetical protein EA411_06895 [Saprospirales bacterium]|nr:MAG: hypothetical protein EA411_06895 [Saprospirales bacterium]
MKATNGLLWMAVLALFGVTLTMGACAENGEKTEEEKQDHLLDREDDVMVIHDEVMPLNNDLRIKANDLMAYFEENVEDIDEETQHEIRTLIERLENAREGMMTWMSDWADTDRDAMDYEEALEYYDREEERISEVADAMRESLKDAEEFLKKHQDNGDDDENES